MIYQTLGKTGVSVSRIALGGHEYLPNGKSRGFNENRDLAATPGYIFDGFVNANRKALLDAAFDNGINLFDVTMDSEKDALGRMLDGVSLPYEIFIQTRPEGMLYDYDPNNVKMARYDTLRAEVIRLLGLLRRERVDLLNLAPLQCAFRHDPEYMDKLADNVRRLKVEGLIRFACADTFSGEETYLRMIASGAFDVVYINFNIGDDRALEKVFPAARAANMGVIGREAYMKGQLFRIAEQEGITDIPLLARAALKWCYADDALTSLVYGTGKLKNLSAAMGVVLEDLTLNAEETAMLDRIRASEGYRLFKEQKDRQFAGLVK